MDVNIKDRLTWYKGDAVEGSREVVSHTVSLDNNIPRLAENNLMWVEIRPETLRVGSPWEYKDGGRCYEGDEVAYEDTFNICRDEGEIVQAKGVWVIEWGDGQKDDLAYWLSDSKVDLIRIEE